jgi:hypothetical protein
VEGALSRRVYVKCVSELVAPASTCVMCRIAETIQGSEEQSWPTRHQPQLANVGLGCAKIRGCVRELYKCFESLLVIRIRSKLIHVSQCVKHRLLRVHRSETEYRLE